MGEKGEKFLHWAACTERRDELTRFSMQKLFAKFGDLNTP